MPAEETQEDLFQARYAAHQARKAETLAVILAERHSDRVYAAEPVDDDTIRALTDTVALAPSSCNRQAIRTVVVDDRDRKALLGGLLVGGVGWIHRAPAIILFMADEQAYKAPGELEYPTCMAHLDAGIAVGGMWLQATAIGLAAAYANPNIRAVNREHFQRVFGDQLFCGALTVGWPRADSPDRAHHAERRRSGDGSSNA